MVGQKKKKKRKGLEVVASTWQESLGTVLYSQAALPHLRKHYFFLLQKLPSLKLSGDFFFLDLLRGSAALKTDTPLGNFFLNKKIKWLQCLAVFQEQQETNT